MSEQIQTRQSRQARRLLDEKYAAGTLVALRVPPRSGWVKAIRTALGMSQNALAKRLGVTRAAVTGLERAEREGAITIAKLSEIAGALDCRLVYALVPNTTLEETVQLQAARLVDQQLGYVHATMALEDQAVDRLGQNSIREERIADAIGRGEIWRTP